MGNGFIMQIRGGGTTGGETDADFWLKSWFIFLKSCKFIFLEGCRFLFQKSCKFIFLKKLQIHISKKSKLEQVHIEPYTTWLFYLPIRFRWVAFKQINVLVKLLILSWCKNTWNISTINWETGCPVPSFSRLCVLEGVTSVRLFSIVSEWQLALWGPICAIRRWSSASVFSEKGISMENILFFRPERISAYWMWKRNSNRITCDNDLLIFYSKTRY